MWIILIFMRYSLHKIKFILFICTIQWVLVTVYGHVHTTKEHFHHPPNFPNVAFWSVLSYYNWPLTITYESSFLVVFPLKMFYIEEIIQYEVLCDLLLLLNIMISIFTHVVSCISMYMYFYFWEVFHCMVISQLEYH